MSCKFVKLEAIKTTAKRPAKECVWYLKKPKKPEAGGGDINLK